MAEKAKGEQYSISKYRRRSSRIALKKERENGIIFSFQDPEYQKSHAKFSRTIFLQRMLSYNKSQQKPTNKNRANFKISSLLGTCIKRLQSPSSQVCVQISLTGFYNNFATKKFDCQPICNEVNTTLVKIQTSGSRSNPKIKAEEVLKLNAKFNENIFIPLTALESLDHPNIHYKVLFDVESIRQVNATNTMSFKLRTISKMYKGEFALNSFVALTEGNYVVNMRESSTNSKLKFHLKLLSAPEVNGPDKVINCKDFLPSKDINNNIRDAATSTQHVEITYKFINRRSSTKTKKKTHKLSCLWCDLNYFHMDALMQHLQLCHSNFNYKLRSSKDPQKLRIDITYNSEYSTTDWPKAIKCKRPTKRVIATQWLVCRKRRRLTAACNSSPAQSNLVVETKQFYHASTLLPIGPHELSIDSDDEFTVDLSAYNRQKVLDKQNFSLKKDERAFIQLWNRHFMNHRYNSFCHMRTACADFVAEFGDEIVRQNLYNAFILHLNLLTDENLITAEFAFSLINRISEMLSTQPSLYNSMEVDITTQHVSNLSSIDGQHSPAIDEHQQQNTYARQLTKNSTAVSSLNKTCTSSKKIMQLPASKPPAHNNKRYATRLAARNLLQPKDNSVKMGNQKLVPSTPQLPNSQYFKKSKSPDNNTQRSALFQIKLDPALAHSENTKRYFTRQVSKNLNRNINLQRFPTPLFSNSNNHRISSTNCENAIRIKQEPAPSWHKSIAGNFRQHASNASF